MSLPPQGVRVRRGLTIALCTLAVVLAAPTHVAAEVRVFTDKDHPIEAPAGVEVIELDAPKRIESDLSAGLPSDLTQAAALVGQRLRDGGRELQQRLADAYQGVIEAWSLGITKIPAVVIDRRYVVYGEPDISRALAQIEAYRRAHP